MAVFDRLKIEDSAKQRLRVHESLSPVAGVQKSFVNFLNMVRGANSKNPERNQFNCQRVLEKSYGARVVTKVAMAEMNGLTGGYIVPIDYSDKLLETVAEESFIYPRATVIPMFSMELSAPRIDVETVPASAGISPFFGGVNFRWGAEDVPVETEPTFRMTSFRAWDLLGYATVSNQWLQDAGAIQESDSLLKAEHYLIKLFGKAAAWYAEWAFLNGSGAALQMPLGLLRSPATFAVTRAGASAISVVDVTNMASRLFPRSWSSAVWAVSPTALAQVQQLAQYQVNVDPISLNKLTPRPCGYLSSLPLFVTEKLPSLGQRGDLILFDPSLYVIAQRMEVVVDVSPDELFRNNQTIYRIWLRLDGKPEFSNTVTLQDTTTVVSPYVVLNA